MKRNSIILARSFPLGLVAALMVGMAFVCSAPAAVVIVDTNAGTINGVGDGGYFNGTQFFGYNGNFRFKGDLNINAGDTVLVQGSSALYITAYNNVNIGAGVSIKFNPSGQTPVGGGGYGGKAPASLSGGTGGVGGDGGWGGFGGIGSTASAASISAILAGQLYAGSPGGPGQAGGAGTPGFPGVQGIAGLSGSNGLNSPASGGAGGTGGQPGTRSDPGPSRPGGTTGGQAGLSLPGILPGTGIYVIKLNGDNGSSGASGFGYSNATNFPAESGGTGGGGSRGVNSGTNSWISAGGGGGAGGNGGSGAGGGGGSGGGGGQGGGGGGSGESAVEMLDGGNGGGGGGGGGGGAGSRGGSSGLGGEGGVGGAAFEIVAMGRLNVGSGSLFQARGGDGKVGQAGGAGQPGGVGHDGGSATISWLGGVGGVGADGPTNDDGTGQGGSGKSGLTGEQPTGGIFGFGGSGGSGARGGDGGDGQQGQTAGTGGTGGPGGGGAGGTVKLSGSVLSSVGASVDTSGGNGPGNAPNGGSGRLILASNVLGGGPGSVTDARVSNFDGSVDYNPFLGDRSTAYIPDLVGGAEIFGKLDGIDATAVDFAALRAAAPGNALAAVLRLDVGPTGYSDDYRGYDMLLLINLSDDPLTDPMLGAGYSAETTGLTPLMTGGWAASPTFGGPGFSVLSTLGGHEVWATLVYEAWDSVNADVYGAWKPLEGVSLTNGQSAFLVPEPATLALLALGGLALMRRRR